MKTGLWSLVPSIIFVFTLMITGCSLQQTPKPVKPDNPKQAEPATKPQSTSQDETSPFMSEDGKTRKALPFPIAYTSERDGNQEVYITLFAADAGTNITNNPSKDYNFLPFRDGALIISTRDGDPDIYFIPLDPINPPENLTKNPAEEQQLAVSLDNQKLLFTSLREGNSDIFLYNREGFPPLNLTRNDATDAFPAWIPDGKSFLFESDRTGEWEIFKQPLEGGTAKNLTNAPSNEHLPTVSNDGNLLSFESDRDGDQEIYLYNFETQKIENISNEKGRDDSPRFSPDNNYLAYNHDLNGKSQIRLLKLNGRITRKLSAEGIDSWISGFSPDSKWVLFVSRQAGNLDVFYCAIDGTEITQVTTDPAGDFYPAFLPVSMLQFIQFRFKESK